MDNTLDNDSTATQLAATFARIQGMLLSTDQAAHDVQLLAAIARDIIPSAVGAGASLFDPSGHFRSTGTTDRVAGLADDLQYQLNEGPCLSASITGKAQRIDDTTSGEDRWPSWCAAVMGLGLRSVISAPALFRGEVLGALKVYSTVPNAFTTRDEERLAVIAGVAGTLVGMSHEAGAPQQLDVSIHTALTDRQCVATAIGMLMERHGDDQAGAQARLMAASRRRERPVVELARDVIAGSTDDLS